MVVGAGPEGNEFVERPREVVAAVSVDGLEESTRVRECDLKDGEQGENKGKFGRQIIREV